MSSFDTLLQNLFPSTFIILGIAIIICLVTYVIRKKDGGADTTKINVPKKPKKCTKFKEGFQTASDPYTGPNQDPLQTSARVEGNFDFPKREVGKSFGKTPLDSYYDDYEAAELDAVEAILDQDNKINIKDEELPDYGGSFAPIDAEISNIPWDSDNKDYLPKDVLWGTVSPEASKSIYLKVYHRTILSDPSSVQEQDESPAYYSPILATTTSDGTTTAGVQAFETLVFSSANHFSPLNIQERFDWVPDGTDSNGKPMYRANKSGPPAFIKMPTKLQTSLKKFNSSLKQKVGGTRVIKILKQLKRVIGDKLTKKIAKFMQIYLIKKIVVYTVMWATEAGLIAASVASLGIASPAAIAWGIVISIITAFLAIIDVITLIAAGLVPTILEKYVDSEGMCPEGSKQIDQIISDPTAYAFFTNLVPLGDLMDIFNPYVCWDEATPKFKNRVFTPPYYYDRTLSLYYHEYADYPRGDKTVRESAGSLCSQPGYLSYNGVCRKACDPGTYAATPDSYTCSQISQTVKPILPSLSACINDRNTSFKWVDDGINCFEQSTNGGCGCIRKTQTERMYCPPAYNLDSSTLLCYPNCANGLQRNGNVCTSTKATYARESYVQSGNNRFIAGNIPTGDLSQVTSTLGISWCNFASPVMLDRMAQFYYNWSYINPQYVDVSGSSLVQWGYIIKFYGVIASSELSCDVACEIRTVQYEPFTGEKYSGMVGCEYSEDPVDVLCYRRFYFIKTPSDTVGVFTVTGCTNTDYTAPDAQVNSWDEDVEYVPSLPKVFNITEKEVPINFGASDFKQMGTTLGISVAGLAIGGGIGGRVSGSIGAIGAAAVEAGVQTGTAALTAELTKEGIEKAKAKLEDKIQNTPSDRDGTYLVGNSDEAYVTTGADYATSSGRKSFITISHGRIKEHAAGIIPSINFCNKAMISEGQCAYKYTLRDTIDRYQAANPNRRVKQVDMIEPRGTSGCYYRWKEVGYDATNNKEDTDFVNKEIIQKYRIDHKETCVFLPDSITTNINDPLYPVRKMDMGGNITVYPTRKKLTKPVRFVRIENGSNWLNFSQIVVLNSLNQNVSRGKTVTASTVLTDSTNQQVAVATNAVDGSEWVRGYPGVYHSQDKTGVFFEVDLEKEESLNSITIYNRGDGSESRLATYKLNCYDATRTLNYTFQLTSGLIQYYADFPAISLERRLPLKSFLVPQSLPVETTLGGATCPTRKCGDEDQLNKLILDFNSANLDKAQIMKVTKAVTPKPDRCDYEVEMMRIGAGGKKTIQIESLAINVAESTTTPCLFTRTADGSALLNSGTFIQANIPELSGLNITGGVMSFSSILNKAKRDFLNPIKTLLSAKPLDTLKAEVKTADTTVSNIYATVAANQTLAGCPTKCNDPAVLQAIMTGYNEANAGSKEDFGVERNTMKRIIKAGVASPTECEIMFEEINEVFDDVLYDAVETNLRIKASRVKMVKQGTTCKFNVALGMGAIIDISSNSVTLSSDSTAITTPFVGRKCTVDCRNTTHIKAIKAKLDTAAVSTTSTTNYKSVTQSYRNGVNVCEYKFLKDVATQNIRTKKFTSTSDLETYVTAVFTMDPATCAATLTSVQEFDPEKVDMRVDRTTNDMVPYVDGVRVTLPLLYSYDDSIPSKQVDIRVTGL